MNALKLTFLDKHLEALYQKKYEDLRFVIFVFVRIFVIIYYIDWL